MRDRTDAGWINESKHSRMSDWMKQVSRCRGRFRAGCGHASQCCAVSGTAVFEEPSLLVLRGCVEGRGHARQTGCGQAGPGRAPAGTATRERTVSARLGPHEVSTKERL